MNGSIISLILITIFIYPILKGLIKKYNNNYNKSELRAFESSLSFLLSLITTLLVIRKYLPGKLERIYNFIPDDILLYFTKYPWLTNVIIFPLIATLFYEIIFFFFKLLNKIIFFPILNGLNNIVKNKSTAFKSLTGALVELPRAVCNLILTVFILNLVAILNINDDFNKLLSESNLYTGITKEIVIPVTNSSVAKSLPSVLDNSFKIKIEDGTGTSPWEDIKKLKDVTFNNNQIIYYNGVTLDEGIKSNESIDKAAKRITAGLDTDRAKARALYTYIGSTVIYDDEKAEKILKNDFSSKSGAIETFNTNKGICFDYACLFVAMSRGAGLKVRMVTGEGYNGISWISHAWNEVYLQEENQWIKIDTTFYKGGNYFNSDKFDLDHKNPIVVGEW